MKVFVLICWLVALVCFTIAALSVKGVRKVDLVAAGLAAIALAQVAQRIRAD